ncbi:MAG: L,D-transpeptidase [Paracoccaceae bacterium]|tara:strand:- start:1568 stop:2062 length:495 start_codon:yes stop_codon:yes gene_type:complete
MHNINDLIVSKWGAQMMGYKFPCSIGRGGIGIKTQEGDGITPSGIWEIEFVMARQDRLRCSASYKINIRDTWSDDPKDPNYNQLSKVNNLYSFENLWRADSVYDLVAVTNFNRKTIRPGLGSAIFLHAWRQPRYPTEGCVAFSRQNLIWILNNWGKKSKIIIRS